MAETLNLSLTENAHDFINSAIKYAQEQDHLSWKYALLNLACALELLIKAILEKENWTLLFENIDVASKESLKKGSFKSVDFNTAITRLKGILGINIALQDEKYLRKIMDIRNRIIHFSIEINLEELKSIVAKGLNLFINFYKKANEDENEVNDFIYWLNEQLGEFKKYVDLHIAQLKDKLEGSERPNPQLSCCPHCLQDTLIIDIDEICCLFCGSQMSFRDLADYSEGIGGPCPECGDGVLALILYNNEDGEFICTKCGFETYSSYNRECNVCGNNFWDDNEEGICEVCWNSIYG